MIVIKLGGAAGIDPSPLLEELAAMEEPWVLVHGGNQELDALTRALGSEPEFFTSPSGHTSRRTTPATIDAMRMAYRGRINNDIVTRLQNLGVRAVGLSGVDGGILRAERKTAVRARIDGRTVVLRDDLSGKITHCDPALLRLLLDNGYRPVVTLPVWADDGHAVNADGDRAAAVIAAALGASCIINLSNVPGLLRDVADPGSLVLRVPRDRLGEADTLANGRFRNKILAAREALDAGVLRVILATADQEYPVSSALAGKGTVIA